MTARRTRMNVEGRADESTTADPWFRAFRAAVRRTHARTDPGSPLDIAAM